MIIHRMWRYVGKIVAKSVIHRNLPPNIHHHSFLSFYLLLGTGMSDVLSSFYPWAKALHIVAVISWMAGLLYLPRLFVHHVEQAETEKMQDVFQMMERKLFKVIMNPASVVTWIFGLMLVFTPGIVDWSMIWPYTKAVAVIGMTWFHHWLGWRLKDLREGRNQLTGRQYRMMNEVPTLLMIVIVLSVVVKF